MFKFHKRKVNTWAVAEILRKFVKGVNTKLIIYYEVTDTGLIRLHTNKPGIVIGKHGKDINQLKSELIKKCNARDVKVIEMNTIISNFDTIGE